MNQQIKFDSARGHISPDPNPDICSQIDNFESKWNSKKIHYQNLPSHVASEHIHSKISKPLV